MTGNFSWLRNKNWDAPSRLSQVFADLLFHISHLYAILNLVFINSGKPIELK
ncbi:hypothetical protein [Nostoc sp. 106C]|uniref:hypothetical protein n=1 Tax=Nostoc sp. 106C TaxID=1932667 RepID=UPI001411BE5D|nr:hypothetical protein [Nostoc sp. 106C]